MIMKAAVYCGKEDLRVKEVPVREPEDNEVVIRVKYCGVCGTDIHIFHGDGGCCDVKPPLIPGHEFSGVVEKVGAAVKTVKPGDRVAGNPNDMCGECYFCKNGKEHFCENNIGVGTTVDGGFAEYVVLREKQVYKFSENLSFIEAAMAEPISCCLNAIDLCNVQSACDRRRSHWNDHASACRICGGIEVDSFGTGGRKKRTGVKTWCNENNQSIRGKCAGSIK